MMDDRMVMGLAKSKGMKNLMANMHEASAYLTSFAKTYLGIYDKNKKLEREGDRHFYLRSFSEINEILTRMEKAVEELNEKVDRLERKCNEIEEKLDRIIALLNQK